MVYGQCTIEQCGASSGHCPLIRSYRSHEGAAKIVEIGTCDELMASEGILYELVNGTKPRVH